jgi:hypothetical protein
MIKRATRSWIYGTYLGMHGREYRSLAERIDYHQSWLGSGEAAVALPHVTTHFNAVKRGLVEEVCPCRPPSPVPFLFQRCCLQVSYELLQEIMHNHVRGSCGLKCDMALALCLGHGLGLLYSLVRPIVSRHIKAAWILINVLILILGSCLSTIQLLRSVRLAGTTATMS